MHPEELLASKTYFNGRILSLRVDTVRLPKGIEATREVVDHKPAVVIIPIDEQDNVVLVRQYRYPVGEALLEAPAGILEDSESPEECALRELQEETGYAARRLQRLGEFWTSPGFCTELMHAFVARELVFSPLEPDEDEDIRTERFTLSRIAEMIRQGEIRDAKTIAAFLMATSAE